MPHRIAASTELFFAIITFFSTLIMSDFMLKIFVATISYTFARLFYHYFGAVIRRVIDNWKNRLNRLR